MTEDSNIENLHSGNFIRIDEYQIETPKDLESFVTEIQSSDKDSDLFARFEHFGNVVMKINEITEEWDETFSITKVLEKKPPDIIGDNIQKYIYNTILKMNRREDLLTFISIYSGVLEEVAKLDEYVNSLH